jgi:hypothetical protein
LKKSTTLLGRHESVFSVFEKKTFCPEEEGFINAWKAARKCSTTPIKR